MPCHRDLPPSMTLHVQSTLETYYDILHVREDASFDEIRQSYRLALLQSHPDKLCKSSEMPKSVDDVDDKFMKVQKAWETLGDLRSRALYDDKLRSLRCDELVAEDVALDDMMVEDNGEELDFCYQCRCGDFFIISWPELEEMGYMLCKDPEDEVSVRTVEGLPGCVILPCSSCSLKIRLLINTNSKHSKRLVVSNVSFFTRILSFVKSISYGVDGARGTFTMGIAVARKIDQLCDLW
ncbi:DPH4 homolog [Chenopodium quinoa]|uniref:DPH4 homolog n=1 Tax=Chenopodium quinoa TaxID=63459 RepID=UPI000B77D8D2|nr:DPH4 homolog [Chenopodium quinoa]